MPDPSQRSTRPIAIKRAYEGAVDSDGYRVLVDRLWPRGVGKDKARIDDWPRALAPSSDLRRWFGHDAARWEEFQRRYRQELNEPEQREALSALVERAQRGPLTIVYGARDEEHNNAVVLRDVLLALLARER